MYLESYSTALDVYTVRSPYEALCASLIDDDGFAGNAVSSLEPSPLPFSPLPHHIAHLRLGGMLWTCREPSVM
jgi:hypothetical protein